MNQFKRNNIFNLLSISRAIFLFCIFLIPLFFYSNNIHNFLNLKLGIFFGAIVLVLILWSISRLKEDTFSFPTNLLSLSIVLIILTSLLSAIFSDNSFVSLFGVQLTLSSFSGLLVLFISMLLAGSLFLEKDKSYFATIIIYISLVLTLLLNFLYIFIDKLPNFGFFVMNSINTIGKWSDMGVIATLVIILSYLIIETQTRKSFIKIFAWIGLILSVIMTLIISETMIWISLGLISIIYLVYKIVISRQNSDESINKNLPYTTITMILISFAMILAGNRISLVTDSWLNINFSETKPGINSTIDLNKNLLKEKPILGVGINRFERAWQEYKPDIINQTNYWGTDFNSAYSYISSVPVQTGLLGILSWLFFITILIWGSIKLLFKKSDDIFDVRLNLLHSFSVIFIVITLFTHIPSVTVLIVFFAFLGIFIGSLQRNGLYKVSEISIIQKPKVGFLYIFAIIVLMIFAIYIGYMSGRQFISTIFLEKANVSLSKGDLDSTQRNLFNSVNTYSTDLNFRALSDYNRIRINSLLQKSSLKDKTTEDAFRNLLANSITFALNAKNFDPNNYQNYLSIANIYEQLVSLKVPEYYDKAIESYEMAKQKNPKNPGIYLDMARTAFLAGKNDVAKDYINKALEMKPLFANASFLLSQIQVAEKNIPEAIKSVESSINIQPNNPNLYFQLGLLNYNINKFSDAVVAFEKAVILRPYFANAKYFLGLSYSKINEKEKAIQQFQDLEKMNPDNKEIKDILENLKNGLNVFENSDSKTNPEDRDDLPVEEKGNTEE